MRCLLVGLCVKCKTIIPAWAALEKLATLLVISSGFRTRRVYSEGGKGNNNNNNNNNKVGKWMGKEGRGQGEIKRERGEQEEEEMGRHPTNVFEPLLWTIRLTKL